MKRQTGPQSKKNLAGQSCISFKIFLKIGGTVRVKAGMAGIIGQAVEIACGPKSHVTK
jgi:hypothetical protein